MAKQQPNRNQFKTPEGRYLLQSDKVHGTIAFNHLRATRLTLASLQGGAEEGKYLVYNVGEALYICRHDAVAKARHQELRTAPAMLFSAY